MASPLNPATLTAILGPTNTGKTHYAVERMLGRSSGVIGLPLRLLAREIYDRICAQKGSAQCALMTGEEKIIPPKARYFVCTVEAMPINRSFAFLAIDEVQLMANHERGHIFTDRVLHARGLEETLLLGAETARPVLQALLPDIRFEHRERFSTLSYAGQKKLTRLPKRSVIVAFSSSEVYALAELIRRYRGGEAVVMGGLSPRTRNAQAELFQNGDVDFLVATDAVGMGLNLDTDHVAFAALDKFDGRKRRMLTAMEAAQIAGRAGRFRNNGTFGTTADCLPMDDELIKRIEDHDFEPLHYAEWRNSALDFSSLNALSESLHIPRKHKRLRRIKGADDEAAFERMVAIDEVTDRIITPAGVKQLWDVCQIPDFRNLTIDAHMRLLQDIYRLLVAHNGKLPDDFLHKHISRLDDISGGVDILSSRLAHIRTWTYCASKVKWVHNAKNWINSAREVEDRLSDALHEALIARFVDRRTSKLLKGVGAEAYMTATIKDNGDVLVDDQLIGQLDGLKFTLTASGSELEAKALKAAAEKVVSPEVNRRLTSLCGGTHDIFTLSNRGHILWGGRTIGRIASGGTPTNPDAELIGAAYGNDNLKALAENRMRDFLKTESKKHLASLYELKALQERPTTTPEARGFAYTLFENNGAIKRKDHWKVLKELDQRSRRQLREANVHFGQYDVYIKDFMKPKPAFFLSLMIAYGAGGEQKPFIPFAGVTSIPNQGDLASENFSPQALSAAGYHAVGPRIARFDILNRLSLQIRQASEQNKIAERGKGFQIMQEMLAIMGCSYEELRGVLTALGYEPKIRDLSAFPPLPDFTQAPDIPKATDKKPDDHPQANQETPQTSDVQTPETTIPEIQVTKPEMAPDQSTITETESTSETTTKSLDVEKTSSEANKPKVRQSPTLHKKPPKPLNIYNHRDVKEDGTTVEIENNEFWVTPYRQKNTRPNKHNKRHQRRKSKPNNSDQVKKYQSGSSKPKSNLKNSPFAALAALKGDKKD